MDGTDEQMKTERGRGEGGWWAYEEAQCVCLHVATPPGAAHHVTLSHLTHAPLPGPAVRT